MYIICTRRRRLLLFWAGMLVLIVRVSASPVMDDPTSKVHLQVFSAVDRTVAAVGTSFAFQVEVLATPASTAAARRVERAFQAAWFKDDVHPLELVRSEPAVIREETSDTGERILILSKRYLFKTWSRGAVSLPIWQLVCAGETYSTYPHIVHIYEFSPGFFESQNAIMPIVVVNTSASGLRTFVRTGTAFLISPDAAITSYHALIEAEEVRLTLPNDKQLEIEKVWAIDPVRDVVIVYVDPEEIKQAGIQPLRMAPLTDTATAPDDQTYRAAVVFTHGWSRGGQRSTAGVHYRGLILRPEETIWISNNPVRPGDSGGPLLDHQGHVLGVVTAGTVVRPSQDILGEEMCIAADPRPALWQKMVAERPKSLYSFNLDPAFTRQPHVRLLRLATLLAMGYRNMPDLDEVMADLNTAIREDNIDDAGLYYMQASIYESLGTKTDALNAYLTALDVYEGYFPAAYMLAHLYLNRKSYAEAQRLFEFTLNFKPYEHLAAYGLAQTNIDQLRYEKAINYLHSVLRFDPTFAPALFRLALCHLALGDKERTRQLLAKLETTDSFWAWRLHQILNNPVLGPVVLRALPRATIEGLSG